MSVERGAIPVSATSQGPVTFEHLYASHHARLFGYINRLSGEPDLAADIVQEAFIRLHQRGALPDAPGAWLVTVATNLLRNARTRGARRRTLAEAAVREGVGVDAGEAAEHADERSRVHAALHRLPPRDQQLLSLLAGGYTYKEMAAALGLHEASVGTLLARAKRAFREHYGAAQ